jgi:hypothetical protein
MRKREKKEEDKKPVDTDSVEYWMELRKKLGMKT